MKWLSKSLCKLLIVSMMLLPFSAHAGLISTNEAIAGAANHANIAQVQEFLARADVAKQFEALGLSATTAQERVNALTQEEINRIAGKIDSLPAGATSNAWVWIIAVIAVAVMIWVSYR